MINIPVQNINQAFTKMCWWITSGFKTISYKQESHPKERNVMPVFIKMAKPMSTKWFEGIPNRGIPSCTNEMIEEYFLNGLMNADKGAYIYTYGNRIANKSKCLGSQIDYTVQILKNAEFTHNAILTVGSPSDYIFCRDAIKNQIEDVESSKCAYSLDDLGKLERPCLQLIHFMSRPEGNDLYLDMYIYYRSWDLIGAFLINMYGLQRLYEYVLELSNDGKYKREVGHFYCISPGLNVRKDTFTIAKKVCEYYDVWEDR